jgi:hypothetical protein
MKNVSLIYRNFSSQSKDNLFRRATRSRLVENVVTEPTRKSKIYNKFSSRNFNQYFQ